MGANTWIFANGYDYLVSIINASEALLKLIDGHKYQIVPTKQHSNKQQYLSVSVSPRLLLHLLKQDKSLQEILGKGNQNQITFVKKQNLNYQYHNQIFALLQKHCTKVLPLSHFNLTTNHYFEAHLLQTFEKPGSIIDLNQFKHLLETQPCTQFPEQYLLIELGQYFTISVQSKFAKRIIFKSLFTQKPITKIISKFIAREAPQFINYSLKSIVSTIFQKGNSQKADLLVEDIFGTDNCSIIGLPPKLIGASLAKYSKESQPTSNCWDQLEALLISFALNIAILTKQQILLTNINKVIFKTSDFRHPRFLHTIFTYLNPYSKFFYTKSNQNELIIASEIDHALGKKNQIKE